MSRTLAALAKLSAILGGLVVVGVTLLTTYSILGRALFRSPVLGDIEIVEVGMTFCVAAFLPICQWRNANIIVDFFTTRASAATRRVLDRLGALLVAAMMGVIAWRAVPGMFSAREAMSQSMMMGIPEWWAYASMVPPLALTAVIALYTAVTGRHGGRHEGADAGAGA